MIHTLQLVLTDLVTEERLQVLVDALRLVESSGQSAPSDELQEIIEIQDGLSDNTMLVSRLTDVLELAINQTLNQLGITCNEDADLAQKVAILTAVVSLEDYIIPEHIAGILGGYFTNEEAIALMVPIFTTMTTEEAIEVLMKVEDATLERLSEVVQNNLLKRGNLEVELPQNNTARIAMLNRLIKATSREQLSVVITLIEAGVRAGRPLSTLLTNHTEELDQFEINHLVVELLALVIFSDHELGDLRAKVGELINEFSDDHAKQRVMGIRLNALLMKVENKS
jgi:hypothetical protein